MPSQSSAHRVVHNDKPMIEKPLRKPHRWPFHCGVRGQGITLLVCLTAGCGATDSLSRQAISGTVTLDGQPLAGGAILFEPTTERAGTAVGATIRQGASRSRPRKALSRVLTGSGFTPAREFRLRRARGRPSAARTDGRAAAGALQ